MYSEHLKMRSVSINVTCHRVSRVIPTPYGPPHGDWARSIVTFRARSNFDLSFFSLFQNHYFLAQMANIASRKYCFTLYNDYEHLREWKDLPPEIAYVVGQVERCPKTQRIHFQGFCALTKPMKPPGFQRLFSTSEKFHVEIPKGSNESNRAYCTKEDSRLASEEGGFSLELGTMPQQGKRTDVTRLLEGIREGRTDREMALSDETGPAMFKYARMVREFREVTAKPRTEPPNVWIFWGPTGKCAGRAHTPYGQVTMYIGTGKSWAAREKAREFGPDETQFWKSAGNKWFDGLSPNATVMIWDEFVPEGAGVDLGFMLRLLDGYVMHVEKKGFMMNFNVPNIIFTSNYNPLHWYDGAAEASVAAWLRRLVRCTRVRMNVPYEPPTEVMVVDD